MHDKYREGHSQPTIELSTGSPVKELEKGPNELKELPIQYPQRSQGLKHEPKSTHGGTHGSSCICSRGWLCWTSKGGEALGPEKARCPSIGECQDRDLGVGGLMSRGRGDGLGDF